MLTIALLFIAIILLLSWKTKRPKNFPPGPPHYPILGSAPSFSSRNLHLTMAGEWLQNYGPLVGLMLGPRKAVAVCGPREVFEVLRRDEFQGRHKNVFITDRSFGKKLGILFADGPFWTEQRRFTIHHLRNFGFGKRSMEISIMEEAEDFIREMQSKTILQVSGLFSVSTLNVMWQMMAGVRYSRDDAELKRLLDGLQLFLRGGAISIVVNLLPFLRHIDPGFLGYNKAMDGIWKMQDYMRKTIRQHASSLDENSPRDFIDVYLIEMKKQADNPHSTFTEEGLIVTCMDFFLGGSESVNSSLGFCLLYMVLYPEVQKKVQKELDAVIGRDRRPTLEDRPYLKYVEAVLAEVTRINPTSPLTPPHCSTKDTTLNGYNIPEDTMLFVSLWNVFHDPTHWGDPDVFRPERFMNSRGDYVKDDWLIQFGMGKRVCPGEVFARNTLFLFFTTFLQEFWFSIPEGDPEPSTVGLPGVVGTIQPFRVKITKRT